MVTRITRQSIALGFVCALGLLVLTGLPTQAQQGTGAITGTVKDQNGDPVGGLVLLLQPEESGSVLPQKIKVNKKGKFAHRFLPNSRYKLKLQGDDLFLESMLYIVRDGSNLELDRLEAKGHPEKGLPVITVLTGQNATLELKIGSEEYRAKLTQQVGIHEAQGDLKKASDQLNSGKHAEALTTANAILEAKPDLGTGFFLRGAALFGLGRLEEAEADLRRAVELIPEQPGLHGTLGDTLLLRADALRQDEATADQAKAVFSESADFFGKELELEGTGDQVLRNQVIALQFADREEDLKAALERLIERTPDDKEPYLQLAEMAAADGNHDEAMAWVDRIPNKGDETVATLFNLAVSLYNDSRYDEAEPILAKAFEIAPDFPELHRLQAGIELVRGNREAAMNGLKKYLELASPDADGVEQSRQLLQALEAAAAPANQ